LISVPVSRLIKQHTQQPSRHQKQSPFKMHSKLIVFFAIVAVSSAGIISQDPWAPQATIIKQIQPAYVKQVVQEAPANYQFAYEVNEPLTGDVKSQHEKAENGAIKGSYQLNDADGYVRIVSI
jgi:hypothetical protein